MLCSGLRCYTSAVFVVSRVIDGSVVDAAYVVATDVVVGVWLVNDSVGCRLSVRWR